MKSVATRTAALKELFSKHQQRLAFRSLQDLIATESDRLLKSCVHVGGISATFARQKLDDLLLSDLCQLAEQFGLREEISVLLNADIANATENRAVWHPHLRGPIGQGKAAQDAHETSLQIRRQMSALASRFKSQGVTDLISVGIGGSDLGPRLVYDALKPVCEADCAVHFFNNVDVVALAELMRQLDPEKTAIVLISKSFGTAETLLNADHLRRWHWNMALWAAVTSQAERAQTFGVPAENILALPHEVGGRYSLWSSVGFPLLMALGDSEFDQLLQGAAAMDRHFQDAGFADSLIFRHAVTAIWNAQGLDYESVAVVPYDTRLALLPEYLQQLVMESLGKGCRLDGGAADSHAGAVVWGSCGSASQHSYFQSLHQSNCVTPVEFVGVIKPVGTDEAAQRFQLANMLAQSQALANGFHSEDPQRHHSGDRPSSIILLEELSAFSLGQLLAMYEHSVFVQAFFLGINPFDQFGVELGKKIGGELMKALDPESGQVKVSDSISNALVDLIRGKLQS